MSDSALVTHNTSKANKQHWHCHLAHLHYNTILCMVAHGMVRGMETVMGGGVDTCEPCILGKQTCAEISKHTEPHSDTVLGCIFSDVCGKLPTQSHAGFKYFITFIDDKSCKSLCCGAEVKIRHCPKSQGFCGTCGTRDRQ